MVPDIARPPRPPNTQSGPTCPAAVTRRRPPGSAGVPPACTPVTYRSVSPRCSSHSRNRRERHRHPAGEPKRRWGDPSEGDNRGGAGHCAPRPARPTPSPTLPAPPPSRGNAPPGSAGVPPACTRVTYRSVSPRCSSHSRNRRERHRHPAGEPRRRWGDPSEGDNRGGAGHCAPAPPAQDPARPYQPHRRHEVAPHPGAQASRPHAHPSRAAQFPRDVAAIHAIAGNGIATRQETQSVVGVIQVREIIEGVPDIARPPRPPKTRPDPTCPAAVTRRRPPGSAGVPPACTPVTCRSVSPRCSSHSRNCRERHRHPAGEPKRRWGEPSERDNRGGAGYCAPAPPAQDPARPNLPRRRHEETPTRERGRPARMHSRHVPLSFPAMGHPTTRPAGNGMGPAEAETWRCRRSTRVEELAEAVPRRVRAGRPRSRVGIIP